MRILTVALTLSLVGSLAFADSRVDRIEELDGEIQRRRTLEYVTGGAGLVVMGAGGMMIDEETEELPALSIGLISAGFGLVVFAGVHALLTSPLVRERHNLHQEIALEQLVEIQEAERERLEATFSDRELAAIDAGEIYIGMSEAALLESWGQPIDINRTVTETIVRKQYVYPHSVYVYVENGVVTGWQD